MPAASAQLPASTMLQRLWALSLEVTVKNTMSSVAVFMTRQDVQIAICCWVISWPTFQNHNPKSSKKHTTKQSHLFMKTNIS